MNALGSEDAVAQGETLQRHLDLLHSSRQQPTQGLRHGPSLNDHISKDVLIQTAIRPAMRTCENDGMLDAEQLSDWCCDDGHCELSALQQRCAGQRTGGRCDVYVRYMNVKQTVG